MAHANARTTVYARRLIVDRVLAGHRPGEVAKQLGVSRQTVHKWVRRWRAEGLAGLADRSSRPHRMPQRTAPDRVAAIIAARRKHHAGPVRLGLRHRLDDQRRAHRRAGRLAGADNTARSHSALGGHPPISRLAA